MPDPTPPVTGSTPAPITDPTIRTYRFTDTDGAQYDVPYRGATPPLPDQIRAALKQQGQGQSLTDPQASAITPGRVDPGDGSRGFEVTRQTPDGKFLRLYYWGADHQPDEDTGNSVFSQMRAKGITEATYQPSAPKVQHTTYRDPNTGDLYDVPYTGSVIPTGEQIMKHLPKEPTPLEKFMGVVNDIGGQVASGLAGGGTWTPPTPDRAREIAEDRAENPVPPGGPPDAMNTVLAPVAAPVVNAASTVGNSARNFAQGALAPGLGRYDQSAQGQNPSTDEYENLKAMFPQIFTDVPGNVAAGAKAVIQNNGDKKIGAVVPDLAPNKLAGVAYNLGTGIASDPLNLLTAGAEPIAGAALRMANATTAGRGAVAAAAAASKIAPETAAMETARRILGADLAARGLAVAPPASSVPMAPTAPLGSSAENGMAGLLLRQGDTPGTISASGVELPPASLPPAGLGKPNFSLEAAAARDRLMSPAGGTSFAANGGSAGSPVSPSVAGSYKQFVTPSSTAGKVSQAALRGYDVVNDNMRALQYSSDFSAPLRQGFVLGVSQPRAVAGAMAAQVKAALSPGAFEQGLADIAARPNASLYKDFGLYLPDAEAAAAGGDAVLRREEAFTGVLAQKIPVVGQIVKGSDRAMTAYLSRLRADSFDNAVQEFAKSGVTPETNPEEFRALAQWINTATGRGDIKGMQDAAPVLSRLLTSPRMQASRLQLMNPATYINMPKATRILALKQAGASLGANVGLITLAGLAAKANPDSGLSVTADPRSVDFGKIRFGDTAYDFTGGFGPWWRLLGQVATGQDVDSYGQTHDADRLATVGRFTQSRMAPLASLATDAGISAWQAATGRPVTPQWSSTDPTQNAIMKRFVPLVIQDAREAAKDGPLLGGLATGAAALGAGVSTRETPQKPGAHYSTRQPRTDAGQFNGPPQ